MSRGALSAVEAVTGLRGPQVFALCAVAAGLGFARRHPDAAGRLAAGLIREYVAQERKARAAAASAGGAA